MLLAFVLADSPAKFAAIVNLKLKPISIFLQAQVIQLFSSWRPSHDVDDDVKDMIVNFLSSRGQDFCQNVVRGIVSKRVSVSLKTQKFQKFQQMKNQKKKNKNKNRSNWS